MRKSPIIEPRPCIRCKQVYTPKSVVQQYCGECQKIRKRERGYEWYKKKNPNSKPKKKCTEPCCVCGGTFAGSFDGKPYCNKHWLRMYNNGTVVPKERKRTCLYEVNGDVLTITTQRGNIIFADSEDYDLLSMHSWCVDPRGYPVSNISGKIMPMHRFLMNPPKGKVVDHMNGDKLDNRKSNLRICTQRQNSLNQRGNKGRELPVGIRKNKAGNYATRISYNRKEVHIGTFHSIEEAIAAREKAEKEYFGKYAQHLHMKGENDA